MRLLVSFMANLNPNVGDFLKQFFFVWNPEISGQILSMIEDVFFFIVQRPEPVIE